MLSIYCFLLCSGLGAGHTGVNQPARSLSWGSCIMVCFPSLCCHSVGETLFWALAGVGIHLYFLWPAPSRSSPPISAQMVKQDTRSLNPPVIFPTLCPDSSASLRREKGALAASAPACVRPFRPVMVTHPPHSILTSQTGQPAQGHTQSSHVPATLPTRPLLRSGGWFGMDHGGSVYPMEVGGCYNAGLRPFGGPVGKHFPACCCP